MKNLFCLLLLVVFASFMVDCNETVANGMPYHEYSSATLDSLDLKNIQSKIYDIFVASLMTKKDDEFISLRKQLVQLESERKNPLIKYWQSYLQYYYSIYKIRNGTKEESEEELNVGIKILESIKNKNSEDYALLGMLQSFSIQFKEGMLAGIASGSVKENVKKALKLDDQNIRAYYVAGSNDFYTPESFGGGKKAEGYFLKAVALPEQKMPNEYLPSWGKDSSYEMLIKFYIKKENWENAKKYYQEAVKSYPDSYVINSLAPKLVGK